MIRGTEVVRAAEPVLVVAALLIVLSSIRERVRGSPDEHRLSPAQRGALSSSVDRPLVFPGTYRDTVVMFLDYRCPYCAALYPDLVKPESPYGIVIRHVAPQRNSVAAQAAVAAECARRQGRFHAYGYALFSKRDSIGSLSWARFGEVAGLPDPQAFMMCVEQRATISLVDEDLAIARALDLSGTPAAIHQGRLYVGPTAVTGMVRALVSRSR